MRKIAIFSWLLFLAGLVFVAAQYTLGSEVTGIFLFAAAPLPNSCLSAGALPNPCFDSDGGYNPPIQGSFAGYFAPYLYSTLFNSWVQSGQPYCFSSVGNEICDTGTNILNEIVCGHDVGVPNGATFTALTGQAWNGTSSEPAALVRVDCTVFAANNPGLGLQGLCQNGACV